jgi:hypothetical protein
MMADMLRLLIFLAACLTGTAGAHGADRRFAVADFDRVIVEGPYAVTLAVGQPSSAMARGSAQALESVVVDVQGTTLRIRRNRHAWGGTPGQGSAPATIILTTRNLRSARVTGTGTLDIAGARGLRVDFAVEGSGQLRAKALQVDNLILGLRGSGSFELQGAAKMLTADIQGPGSLNGAALETDTATLIAATSGTIGFAARTAVKVVANGLGEIAITGRPACTISGPGAAQVRCGPQR